MQKKPAASIDLLIPSVTIIKDNLPTFFILLVIPLLLSSVTGAQGPVSDEPTFSELLESLQNMVTPYMIAGSVLSLLFYPFLTFAQWRAGSGKPAPLKEVIQDGSKQYWKLLGLFLLMSLIIAAGFIALIIPGIIFIRCFILAPFYLLQDKSTIREALRRSARESKRYKWSIYGVLGIIILFNLISGFGVVGQICGTILSVLYSAAFALRFHEIRSLAKAK